MPAFASSFGPQFETVSRARSHAVVKTIVHSENPSKFL